MNEENKNEQEEMVNPIDALFDEDNVSPISLYNEKGEEVKFEQIAIIPLDESVYAILQPLNQMEGVGEDEALVFEITEATEEDEESLKLVADLDIIDKVFDVYNNLMDEEEAKQKIDTNKGNK